jgi:LPXTG-motif cell wall-anchored protein
VIANTDNLGMTDYNGYIYPNGSAATVNLTRSSYNIAYNLDGGSFASSYNTTHKTSAGVTQKQNPTSAYDGPQLGYDSDWLWIENPTKTGYTFKGWNITGMDSDNHAVYTSNAGTYRFTDTTLNTTTNSTTAASSYIPFNYMYLRSSSGTVTFNALWEANKYTVNFDGNGASIGSMINQTFTYDTSSNLNSNAYGKTGYKFLGWSTNKYAATATYANNESVENLTATSGATVTLYAVWQKNSTILTNANVLKNIEKMLQVNVIKVDKNDDTKTLDATFDVYEWSAKLNNGYGAYKSTSSFSIQSNEDVAFNYTSDNLGKFKIKETSVESPYINQGDEVEINMLDCTDIPFYENTMVEEDKGVFVNERGYEKGNIVRDTASLSGATYYQAKVANTGHSLSETAYWQKLNSSNYSQYDRLVAGAGEWNTSNTYAKCFTKYFTNGKSPETGATFSIRKKDESGTLLTGATFNVYYADDNSLCRIMGEESGKTGLYSTEYDENGQIYTNPQISVDDRQTHAVNTSSTTKTLELIVKEDTAPTGYKKIDDFTVLADIVYDSATNKWNTESLTATFSDGKQVVINDGGTFDVDELVDESFKLDINVVKESDKGNYSIADLAGAEYTVYEDEDLTLPVTTITVNTFGTGSALNLPLKDYWIKETKTPSSGLFFWSDEVKKVSVTPTSSQSEYSTTVKFVENEDSGKLLVHKIDENGDTLNGAGFSLYKCPSDLTEETVDSYDFSSLKAVATATVENGYAKFSELPFDTYVLVETTVPDGYKKAASEIITISSENGGNSDNTAKMVTVVNYKEESKIKIIKESSVDNSRLSNAVFKIYDVTNSEYIRKDVVNIDEDGNTVESQEDALYSTDKNGTVTTDGLTNGTYRIEEVTPPDGFIINTKSQTVTIKKGNEDGTDEDGTPYYKVTFVDTPTETWFTKCDITTQKEIKGGEYTVEDMEGNTIDHWTGDGTTHKVYGLTAGAKYTFIEEVAPDGYTIASQVEFSVNTDGTVTKVYMYDDYTKVDISKADITTGEEIEGATLELYDSDGKLVESWTSETKAHRINRLPVGTYKLVETQAPDGYVIAESITFNVGESEEVQEVVMYDDYTKTEFIKLASDTGEPLSGCVLQVLDKNKKVVDEWTTETKAHETDYLTKGETYYLHEVSSPDDYQLADDIEFVAGKQWSDGNSTTEDDYNKMDGTQYTDQGGNVVNFDDGKVKTDTPEDDLTEETTKSDVSEDGVEAGDVTEEDISEVPKDSGYDSSAADMVTITMLDKPKLVSVIKKTNAGTLLTGAELELINDSTGEVINTWTTNSNVESVFKLSNGKYTIHEKYAPENYKLAEDIHFEVTDDTTEVEYEMVDEYIGGSITVVKLDEKTNEPLEGVEFTLVGENGLTLKATTDKNGEIVFGVKDGVNTLPPQKYTLTETSSKDGYSLLEKPEVIELPLKLTEAEAKAYGADLTKGKWDKENEVYRFYNLTYQVSDAATFTLPTTGNSNITYAILAGVAIFVLAILYFLIRKRRKKVTK